MIATKKRIVDYIEEYMLGKDWINPYNMKFVLEGIIGKKLSDSTVTRKIRELRGKYIVELKWNKSYYLYRIKEM